MDTRVYRIIIILYSLYLSAIGPRMKQRSKETSGPIYPIIPMMYSESAIASSFEPVPLILYM